MRKTKIIATVGPACGTEKKLTALVRAGVDIFRINASHTTPRGIQDWTRRVRRAETRSGKTVSILVDLQGPRIRTGKLKDNKPVFLKSGARVMIAMSSNAGTETRITTACREFSKMVKAGDQILLDNGLLELRVLSIKKEGVLCKVITGGTLGENKGINLPHAPVTLPALSRKDQMDLKAAVRSGADFIALSFVRSEKDVCTLKDWLRKHGQDIPVIAKIEKPRAVDRIDLILKESGGVMVARGDLGIEMGVEKVPVIQKKIIEDARGMKIPVITATQMLESMMENARPTRAEASDIANAVLDGTDAVMLSGETSIGRYPLESVRMMAKIIEEAERGLGEIPMSGALFDSHSKSGCMEDAIVHAARHAAMDTRAKAILVFTRSGKMVASICKYRPLSGIFALAPSVKISRRLTIFRGVTPLLFLKRKNLQTIFQSAYRLMLKKKRVKRGDVVITLAAENAFPSDSYLARVSQIT